MVARARRVLSASFRSSRDIGGFGAEEGPVAGGSEVKGADGTRVDESEGRPSPDGATPLIDGAMSGGSKGDVGGLGRAGRSDTAGSGGELLAAGDVAALEGGGALPRLKISSGRGSRGRSSSSAPSAPTSLGMPRRLSMKRTSRDSSTVFLIGSHRRYALDCSE